MKKSKKIIVIAEYTSENELNKIRELAEIKYILPCINSCAFFIEKEKLNILGNLKGIKAVHKNTHITAQMNNARKTVNADNALLNGNTGEGITIAILDTGIAPINDFTLPRNRIIAFKDFINNAPKPYDDNGHGTHVSGIACGNGMLSNSKYRGIAPLADIVAIKILNHEGKGNLADVLAGIQWVIDNKRKYNIRVANLSIGTESVSVNDPLVKAVEKAWDLGIVFTVAAGNNGPQPFSITSPGVSKKVVTVGASDDEQEVKTIWGDKIINYSGRGPTRECIIKPDTIAPSDIVSCFPPSVKNTSAEKFSDFYVRLSGTSMSTPIVSGSIALLLQKYPHLTPNEVKLQIKKSCHKTSFPPNRQGWGLIDVEMLLKGEK